MESPWIDTDGIFRRSSNSTRTSGVMIARRLVAMLFALSILPAVVMALTPEPTLIPILLADFKFVPGTVRLQPHTTYLLRLTNSGAGEHALSAPTSSMAPNTRPDYSYIVR